MTGTEGRSIFSARVSPVRWVILASLLLIWAALFLYSRWYVSLPLMVVLFSSVIFLVRPEAAAYLMVFLVPTFFNYVGFYLNESNIGVRTNKIFPLFMVFLIPGALALLLKKLSRLHEGIKGGYFLGAASVLLVIYAAVSLSWAPSLDYGLVSLVIIMLNMVLCYFIIGLVNSETLHRRLMLCWVLAGVITAALVSLSIFDIPREEFFYRKVADLLTFIYNNSTKVKVRGHALGHPNAASTILNMAMSVNVGLLLFEKEKLIRRLLWASLMFMLFANFLTMSKAGIGSMIIVGCVFLVVYARLRKRIIRNAILGIAAIVLVFVLSLIYTQEKRTPRLLNVSYRGQVISLDDRFKMWRAGLAQMKLRGDKVKGLGPGGFDYTTGYPHSHNLFLSFFFDFGAVGLVYASVLFLAFGKKIVTCFIRNFREQTTYLQVMTIAFSGGLLALGIHSTVDQYYFKSVIWLFFGLAVSTFNLSDRAK
ncbi:MAG: O-antigen ligase family protein [Deltaproteobacteria bacterium]|nr:O-antigen ligase family protein [Deltaproteobacteria bacterium]